MPMGRKMSLRSAMGAMWKSLLQKVYCFVDVHFLRALLRGLTFSDFAAWPYVIVVVPGARFSSRVATPRRTTTSLVHGPRGFSKRRLSD